MGERDKIDYSKVRMCENCYHGLVESLPDRTRRTLCVKNPPVTHGTFIPKQALPPNIAGSVSPDQPFVFFFETYYPIPAHPCSQFDASRRE